jgi:hypothetical protein
MKLFNKKTIKKILPNILIDLLGHLININFRYHSFQYNDNSTCVSDLFLYRKGEFQTHFIAENRLGMLMDQKVTCHHTITCFDRNGKAVGVLKTSQPDVHAQINLCEISQDLDEYGGFVHTTRYDLDSLEKCHLKEKMEMGLHRSYTGYRPVEYGDDGVFSYVHGNFGGVSIDDQGNIKLRATSRKPFCYVPQFSFESKLKYELFFFNPTPKTIKVKLYSYSTYEDDSEIGYLEIPSLGTQLFIVDSKLMPNKTSNCIYWVSNLPIYRSVCFEHNPQAMLKTFNVFHT